MLIGETIMNRIQLLTAAVLVAASGGAWAGGGPYPAMVETVSTKSRADVVAEMREAARLGQMATVETPFPTYRAADVVAGEAFIVWGDKREAVLRAKIRAETRMAGNLGLLRFGEGDPPIATAEQERLIAAAGQDAVERALIG